MKLSQENTHRQVANLGRETEVKNCLSCHPSHSQKCMIIFDLDFLYTYVLVQN